MELFDAIKTRRSIRRYTGDTVDDSKIEAILEAGRWGKPVVGGNTGGIPDAVTHEKTGLLVDPENVSEVADSLVRILSDADFARRLGQAGRRRVASESNWDNASKRLAQILSDIHHA